MAESGDERTQQDSEGNLGPSTTTLDVTPPTMTDDNAQMEGSSDGEGERAARERLKKTSIAGMAQQAKNADSDTDHSADRSGPNDSIATDPSGTGNGNGIRGRPAKKRSFEDITRGDAVTEELASGTADTDPSNSKSRHHKRMRSRDVATGEGVAARLATTGNPTSPVHEEGDADALKSPGGPGILVDVNKSDLIPASSTGDDDIPTESGLSTDAQTSGQLSEATAQSSSTLAPTSGFANSSSTSPFGAAQNAATPSSTETVEERATAPSTFASSGLSAFAASEKSPFGAVAKPSGGFGGSSSTSGFGASTGSGFGSGTSFGSKQHNGGFGASAGFGSSTKFGGASGFAAATPFGSGLSSFAKAAGSSSGFGPGKPFGAAKEKFEDGDGSDDDDDEDDEDNKDEGEEQDERFVAKDVETGEEEEQTIFACRAKLYHFEKEWKERGVGTIKINMREESNDNPQSEDQQADEEAGLDRAQTDLVRRGRLIMRTDGVHRLILNTPIFRSMTIGQADGSEPVGKTMHLTGLEGGKPQAFQIKIGKEEVMRELYWKVVDLRSEARA